MLLGTVLINALEGGILCKLSCESWKIRSSINVRLHVVATQIQGRCNVNLNQSLDHRAVIETFDPSTRVVPLHCQCAELKCALKSLLPSVSRRGELQMA